MDSEVVQRFFAFAQERHAVNLRRRAGLSAPWTDDPIIGRYRFTNVFRELDRTTVWLRESVRGPLSAEPEVLLAVVLFRWFNRIETGEVIFGQSLLDGGVPWTRFLATGSTIEIHAALMSAAPKGPYVTGAYMIRSPDGMDKLQGVLRLCQKFHLESGWRAVAEDNATCRANWSMEQFTQWLSTFMFMGPFLAYEVACDLRYTCILERATDAMTWANLGPGAKRGLNRIHGRFNEKPRKPKYYWSDRSRQKPEKFVQEMHDLLLLSQTSACWPKIDADLWPAWDMRTVEHTLCEFDKYERVRLGEGEPKQRYQFSVAAPLPNPEMRARIRRSLDALDLTRSVDAEVLAAA